MPPVNEGGVPSHERQPLLEPRSNPTDRQVSSPTRIAPDYNGILPGGDTSKNLSWTSAYILVMSRVIGSGIFATPGSIVKSAGSVGLTLLVWLAGTILAACGLAVSLELGCLLPKSGGDKVYLEHAYPRPKYLASTLIAVHAVVLGFTASNCIVFAKYFTFAFSIEANDFQQKLLAVSLLTVITILHGFFLRPGIWIQNVLGWLKLFIVGIVSVTGAGIVVLRLFESNVEATPVSEPRGIVSWDTLWEGSNWSWSLLSTALFKVFYSYAGLTNVNNVMSEVKNPVRTLKTVCPTALLTSGALYFLANLSYLLVIPLDEIKNGGELVGALLFERVFGQHFGKTLFPLAIAICAGERDGGHICLYVEAYPGQILALGVTVGLLVLRYREPTRFRPFKAWLPAVWLRVVMCIVLLVTPWIPPPNWQGDVDFFYATYAIVGIGVLLFAVFYWYIWTVYLPRRGGYRLEEQEEILKDGTSVTRLLRVNASI
ncbi:hypothetical protein N7468_008566 [Penicillium chermesinum]|uniref:Amino acid transporter n=1 Tax=Penicillium chermesinum TaxID=63820 RepID=A0A9W9NQ15_9EURO|nr:uncharacterized protein N7468_008566 [Penicillium chermesinum]KAJ5224024.1 hypothetical protein N7468_008566 [Penicillium chermesinum]